MSIFSGEALYSIASCAQRVFDKWRTKDNFPGERRMLSTIMVIVTDGAEPDLHGVAFYADGQAVDMARGLRGMAKQLWRRNPMLCLAFQAGVQEMAEKELGDMVQQWLKGKGLTPTEGDPTPQSEAIDEEVAYAIYLAARRSGTPHSTLVEMDPRNERHLPRYEQEEGHARK